METVPGVPVKFVSKVQVDWQGEEKFSGGRVGASDAERITIDHHGKEGPGPVEAFLVALATCTAIDVLSIMQKCRAPVASMRIEVDAARADAVPKRVVGIVLTYHIDGEDMTRVQVERAVGLSVSKYCSVRDSLDPSIPVRWAVVLNGEAGVPRAGVAAG